MTAAIGEMIGAVWHAAIAGGVTERCEVNGRVFDAIYRREDAAVLDDLALSAGHRLIAPADSVEIEEGDELRIGERWFVARRIERTRDGLDMTVWLSELT